jgi:hypothetical protein
MSSDIPRRRGAYLSFPVYIPLGESGVARIGVHEKDSLDLRTDI